MKPLISSPILLSKEPNNLIPLPLSPRKLKSGTSDTFVAVEPMINNGDSETKIKRKQRSFSRISRSIAPLPALPEHSTVDHKSQPTLTNPSSAIPSGINEKHTTSPSPKGQSKSNDNQRKGVPMLGFHEFLLREEIDDVKEDLADVRNLVGETLDIVEQGLMGLVRQRDIVRGLEAEVRLDGVSEEQLVVQAALRGRCEYVSSLSLFIAISQRCW
jgi:hypothetical protein